MSSTARPLLRDMASWMGTVPDRQHLDTKLQALILTLSCPNPSHLSCPCASTAKIFDMVGFCGRQAAAITSQESGSQNHRARASWTHRRKRTLRLLHSNPAGTTRFQILLCLSPVQLVYLHLANTASPNQPKRIQELRLQGIKVTRLMTQKFQTGSARMGKEKGCLGGLCPSPPIEFQPKKLHGCSQCADLKPERNESGGRELKCGHRTGEEKREERPVR
jgi:hypothetical protein